IELDPAAAQLAVQNISDNALTAQIICGDLRERTYIPSDSMQLVISNPPYFRQGSGKSGGSFRMDMTCSVEALCGTASRILRSGGRFAVVFRAERLADLICAMRSVNIEPKRLQFLAHPQKMPYGVLLEGVKHGGVGLDLLY
ncbi:MAG: methyltransferase, partial [Evtepia sp.]